MHAYIKLIAFELAAKFSRRRQIPLRPRLSRITRTCPCPNVPKTKTLPLHQREKRNFQTAQNGVLPSVAIFAGQLKRNQLYVHNSGYGTHEKQQCSANHTYIHACMHACMHIHIYVHNSGYETHEKQQCSANRENLLITHTYIHACMHAYTRHTHIVGMGHTGRNNVQQTVRIY